MGRYGLSQAETSIIDGLNDRAPEFIKLLGGKVVEIDKQQQSCTFEFNIGHQLCHSVDIVQGGFVTAMLDATMSHTAFGIQNDIVNVATLEIKVSFFEPSRAGHFRCVGRLRKVGRSTGFMEAELYNADGLLTASATTTAKLVRAGQDRGRA
jgi:uncharacterized protein (TIGR00369 family)